MKIHLYYPSDILEEFINVTIIPEPYVVNKMTKRFLVECKDDKELGEQLDKILKDLDCSVILNCGKLVSTDTPKYNNILSLYQFYFDQITHDECKLYYQNALQQLMINNILFDRKYFKENNNIERIPVVKKKKPVTKKKTPIWTTNVSKDLFTGETMYIYTNNKTGEIVKTHDKYYLNKLKGTKPKKEKVTHAVSMSSMTFNFNIKKV